MYCRRYPSFSLAQVGATFRVIMLFVADCCPGQPWVLKFETFSVTHGAIIRDRHGCSTQEKLCQLRIKGEDDLFDLRWTRTMELPFSLHSHLCYYSCTFLTAREVGKHIQSAPATKKCIMWLNFQDDTVTNVLLVVMLWTTTLFRG